MGKKSSLAIPREAADVSKLVIEDPKNIGPLPQNSLTFLASMGARKVVILDRDGRSWIVCGKNYFGGEVRPFVCRVFLNGFVRDYIALPLSSVAAVSNAMLSIAEEIIRDAGAVSPEAGVEGEACNV